MRSALPLRPLTARTASRLAWAARWLAILALTACSAGSMGDTGAVGPSGGGAGGRTDLETEAVCRQEVNQMIEAQNRPEIYAAHSSANSPYSANSDVGVTSRGLSGQFAYDQRLAACERNAGTGPDVMSPGQNTIPPGARVP